MDDTAVAVRLVALDFVTALAALFATLWVIQSHD